LIIDNNSNDGSIDCAEENYNVSIRALDNNLGFAVANNRAITECNTEFIALLNPDAFPENDWLELLVKSAKLNQNVAAFGSRQLVYKSPNLLDGIGDI